MRDCLAPEVRYRTVRRSTADRLREAVLALSDRSGEVSKHHETPWSSITFSGTRHELVIEFAGVDEVEAGERLIHQLPEHEFRIPGHLVADASVREIDHQFGTLETLQVTCVLLLLEET